MGQALSQGRLEWSIDPKSRSWKLATSGASVPGQSPVQPRPSPASAARSSAAPSSALTPANRVGLTDVYLLLVDAYLSSLNNAPWRCHRAALLSDESAPCHVLMRKFPRRPLRWVSPRLSLEDIADARDSPGRAHILNRQSMYAAAHPLQPPAMLVPQPLDVGLWVRPVSAMKTDDAVPRDAHRRFADSIYASFAVSDELQAFYATTPSPLVASTAQPRQNPTDTPMVLHYPDQFQYSLWDRRADGQYHAAAWSFASLVEHLALALHFATRGPAATVGVIMSEVPGGKESSSLRDGDAAATAIDISASVHSQGLFNSVVKGESPIIFIVPKLDAEGVKFVAVAAADVRTAVAFRDVVIDELAAVLNAMVERIDPMEEHLPEGGLRLPGEYAALEVLDLLSDEAEWAAWLAAARASEGVGIPRNTSATDIFALMAPVQRSTQRRDVSGVIQSSQTRLDDASFAVKSSLPPALQPLTQTNEDEDGAAASEEEQVETISAAPSKRLIADEEGLSDPLWASFSPADIAASIRQHIERISLREEDPGVVCDSRTIPRRGSSATMKSMHTSVNRSGRPLSDTWGKDTVASPYRDPAAAAHHRTLVLPADDAIQAALIHRTSAMQYYQTLLVGADFIRLRGAASAVVPLSQVRAEAEWALATFPHRRRDSTVAPLSVFAWDELVIPPSGEHTFTTRYGTLFLSVRRIKEGDTLYCQMIAASDGWSVPLLACSRLPSHGGAQTAAFDSAAAPPPPELTLAQALHKVLAYAAVEVSSDLMRLCAAVSTDVVVAESFALPRLSLDPSSTAAEKTDRLVEAPREGADLGPQEVSTAAAVSPQRASPRRPTKPAGQRICSCTACSPQPSVPSLSTRPLRSRPRVQGGSSSVASHTIASWSKVHRHHPLEKRDVPGAPLALSPHPRPPSAGSLAAAAAFGTGPKDSDSYHLAAASAEALAAPPPLPPRLLELNGASVLHLRGLLCSSYLAATAESEGASERWCGMPRIDATPLLSWSMNSVTALAIASLDAVCVMGLASDRPSEETVGGGPFSYARLQPMSFAELFPIVTATPFDPLHGGGGGALAPWCTAPLQRCVLQRSIMDRILDESSSVRVLCGLSDAFATPEPAHHENTEAAQSLPVEVVFGRPGAAQILTQLVSWLGSLLARARPWRVASSAALGLCYIAEAAALATPGGSVSSTADTLSDHRRLDDTLQLVRQQLLQVVIPREHIAACIEVRLGSCLSVPGGGDKREEPAAATRRVNHTGSGVDKPISSVSDIDIHLVAGSPLDGRSFAQQPIFKASAPLTVPRPVHPQLDEFIAPIAALAADLAVLDPRLALHIALSDTPRYLVRVLQLCDPVRQPGLIQAVTFAAKALITVIIADTPLESLGELPHSFTVDFVHDMAYALCRIMNSSSLLSLASSPARPSAAPLPALLTLLDLIMAQAPRLAVACDRSPYAGMLRTRLARQCDMLLQRLTVPWVDGADASASLAPPLDLVLPLLSLISRMPVSPIAATCAGLLLVSASQPWWSPHATPPAPMSNIHAFSHTQTLTPLPEPTAEGGGSSGCSSEIQSLLHLVMLRCCEVCMGDTSSAVRSLPIPSRPGGPSPFVVCLDAIIASSAETTTSPRLLLSLIALRTGAAENDSSMARLATLSMPFSTPLSKVDTDIYAASRDVLLTCQSVLCGRTAAVSYLMQQYVAAVEHVRALAEEQTQGAVSFSFNDIVTSLWLHASSWYAALGPITYENWLTTASVELDRRGGHTPRGSGAAAVQGLLSLLEAASAGSSRLPVSIVAPLMSQLALALRAASTTMSGGLLQSAQQLIARVVSTYSPSHHPGQLGVRLPPFDLDTRRLLYAAVHGTVGLLRVAECLSRTTVDVSAVESYSNLCIAVAEHSILPRVAASLLSDEDGRESCCPRGTAVPVSHIRLTDALPALAAVQRQNDHGATKTMRILRRFPGAAGPTNSAAAAGPTLPTSREALDVIFNQLHTFDRHDAAGVWSPLGVCPSWPQPYSNSVSLALPCAELLLLVHDGVGALTNRRRLKVALSSTYHLENHLHVLLQSPAISDGTPHACELKSVAGKLLQRWSAASSPQVRDSSQRTATAR